MNKTLDLKSFLAGWLAEKLIVRLQSGTVVVEWKGPPIFALASHLPSSSSFDTKAELSGLLICEKCKGAFVDGA